MTCIPYHISRNIFQCHTPDLDQFQVGMQTYPTIIYRYQVHHKPWPSHRPTYLCWEPQTVVYISALQPIL